MNLKLRKEIFSLKRRRVIDKSKVEFYITKDKFLHQSNFVKLKLRNDNYNVGFIKKRRVDGNLLDWIKKIKSMYVHLFLSKNIFSRSCG